MTWTVRGKVGGDVSYVGVSQYNLPSLLSIGILVSMRLLSLDPETVTSKVRMDQSWRLSGTGRAGVRRLGSIFLSTHHPHH
jgi:hypothetical protein